VTTISEPDRRQLLDLHGPASNLHVIRNGVPDRLLDPLGPSGSRRGVAFWGNLAFGPNCEALRFFVEQVFVPFLAAEDVELCVVGHHAPEWLVDISRREPGIVVTGFVPDLAAAVGGYPIMINPMRTGSGLKNKVLEAFGLGLAVISTRLGVDALGEVRDGEHLVLADEPADLAREVLALLGDDGRRDGLRTRAHDLVSTRYPWDRVGQDWRALLGGTGAPAYQVT
jgi:glycosyltransferase involved in cell wall biosynthesis